jgi:hypothetical protein
VRRWYRRVSSPNCSAKILRAHPAAVQRNLRTRSLIIISRPPTPWSASVRL